MLKPAESKKKTRNINTLENLSKVYPWAEDMVKGKGGRKAVSVSRNAATRVSERQQKILRGGK